MGEQEKNYIVNEIQTDADNVTTVISTVYDDLNTAYQKFYTILAFAAVSELPVHSATIFDNYGYVEAIKSFSRPELFVMSQGIDPEATE